MPFVPTFIKSRVGAIMADHGETVTLKRASEGTTVALKAKRLAGQVDDLAGGTLAQQEFRLRLGTAELAASSWASKVPARGDSVVIGGFERSVLDARPISDGDTVVLYELTVAG